MTAGDADARIGNLPLPGFAAQLRDGFRDMGQFAEVITGEQAAARVDRHASAGADAAIRRQCRAFAFLAPAIVLDLKKYFGGEAVVEAGEIDIVDRNVRLTKGDFLGGIDGELGIIRLVPPKLCHCLARSGAQHHDRRLWRSRARARPSSAQRP